MFGKFFAVLTRRNTAGEMIFHPSRSCPECGSKLCKETGREAAWSCPNLDCPARVRARLEHWCSTTALNIAGVDAGLVAKLVGNGLARDVAELYRLKAGEIAAVEGMDTASAKFIFDAIVASRKREAWRLLFGLGIPRLSPTEAQALCRHFGSVDSVFAASVERLMQAEGVSAETARGISLWHGDGVNRRLVRRLFKAGLNFKFDASSGPRP
jgi:DNA ligase (NAD+)